MKPGGSKRQDRGSVRFAVVGAGRIALNAVLPAFKNAAPHCRLTAIFSSDESKRRSLAKAYGVDCMSYESFDDACRSDLFDAVYIALPNSLHRDYTVRAAAAGKHILCEKPLAVSHRDCQAMVDAARAAKVHLMTAYRLHFEPANLKAVRIAQSGKLGRLRAFNSTFSMQVRTGSFRTTPGMGGGPLHEIGVYCINAARYIFQSNPLEVCALEAASSDPRFAHIEEAIGAIMRFPDDRLATFYCGFGAAFTDSYQVIGEKGDLLVSPAFGYGSDLKHRLTVGRRVREEKFNRCDQFALQLLHLAECIRKGRTPGPGGMEGLIDVAIINAIHESAKLRRPVKLTLPPPRKPAGRRR